MTYTFEDYGKDFKMLAHEKLDKEFKEFSGDRYGKEVYTYVANALREFLNQSEDFAKVFYKTKRSFSDCVAEIMKGCGKAISDIEVYRRAAKFYFPDSEVEFQMIIKVGEEPNDKYVEKEKKNPAPKAAGIKEVKQKKTSAVKEKAQEIQISLF